jgi:hypothetical protein
MKTFLTAFSITIFFVTMFSSCKKSNSSDATVKDTWAIINENILTPSCATSGCHAATTDATYLQHNLVLTANVAYENLVNVASKNTNANTDGLARVKPGDFVKSLLYYKVDCASGYGTTNYGAKMPLGSGSLSAGKIEFIKQWIIKGAPKTGSVVDEAVLKNETICVQPFVPLDPPTAAEGFQLKIDPFSVLSNKKKYAQCYYGLCKQIHNAWQTKQPSFCNVRLSKRNYIASSRFAKGFIQSRW